MNVTHTQIARGMRSGTAYAVQVDGTFIGYVVGRDGGWSAQPESDPNVPVEPAYTFTFAYASRATVTQHLVDEATDAGLIGVPA